MDSVPLERKNSFEKSSRLLKREDFARLKKNSSRLNSVYFTAFCCENGLEKSLTRIGCAISKKVLKNASKRNYVKRIIREVFRTSEQKELGVDVLVVVRGKAKKLIDQNVGPELISDLGKLLKKLPKKQKEY